MIDSNRAVTVADKASGFALFLNPDSMEQVREVANMLAESDMVPKAYKGKPGDIIIAGAMGARLGLDLFSALSGIATINGRPCIWGDAMLAVCQQHRDWQDFVKEFTGKPESDDYTAVCSVTRKGRSAYVATFAMWEARHAGLLTKQGPWTTNPKRMLQMRARAFALRGAFADALSGFHAREEMEGVIEVEGQVTGTDPLPAAKEGKRRGRPPGSGTDAAPADHGTQEGAKAGDSGAQEAPKQSDPSQGAAAAPEGGKSTASAPAAQQQPAQVPAKQDPPPAARVTYEDFRNKSIQLMAESPALKAEVIAFAKDNGLSATTTPKVCADPVKASALLADLIARIDKVRLAAGKGGAA